MADSEQRSGQGHSPNPELRNNSRWGDKPLKEMIFIAESAAHSGLKAVPGSGWAFHYPSEGAVRNERLQGLLKGKYQPSEVANDLRPDALIFDTADIENSGLDAVTARINAISDYQSHYDYQRFAEFVASMRGKEVVPNTLQQIYDAIAQSRLQKRIYDSLTKDGQAQLKLTLEAEVTSTQAQWPALTTVTKVFNTLKYRWLSDDLRAVDSQLQNVTEHLLKPEEKNLLDQFQEPYRNFVQMGSEASYKELIHLIKDALPALMNDEAKRQQAKQELSNLESFKDQSGNIGTEADPDIAPEDHDEYDVQPLSEKDSVKTFYEISPPLTGYFQQGRKSYYDIDRMVWSKKKVLSPYQGQPEPMAVRHTLRGNLGQALVALPIPEGYTIDTASLKVSNGVQLSFFRDQNGIFYIKGDAACTFTVDFQKDSQPFPDFTIPEDLAPLYSGNLSQQTEEFLSQLQGSNTQKARYAVTYISAHHQYPGDGDLQAAHAVQYKLRTESSRENYIQNIDKSTFLECYSANTLFCAMMRKVGVPARLVGGDKIDEADNDKSAITSETGHAWSEIWNGLKWVRFDATPAAGEESGESADNSQQLDNATDSQLQSGNKQLENAKQQVAIMESKFQAHQQKISETGDFSNLQRIQEIVNKEDLSEALKEQLKEAIKDKRKELRNQLSDLVEDMAQGGFMDEERKDQYLKALQTENTDALKKMQDQLQDERRLYDEYDEMREVIQPYVDKWWEYLADILPKEVEIDVDEDSLARRGFFNVRAAMRFSHFMQGRVFNPRIENNSLKPKFIAKILLDTSLSMEGTKLYNGTLLLIFYNEILSKISQEFGYVRYSIDTFAQGITEVKGFDQDYNSSARYTYSDGSVSTVKMRLMRAIRAKSGTNMLDAVKKAGRELNEETAEFPDYISALYYIGDGGDTEGNSARVSKYLQARDAGKGGFGKHISSAILLGSPIDRYELAEVFGDDATTVASDLESLIEQSMLKLANDISSYWEEL